MRGWRCEGAPARDDRFAAAARAAHPLHQGVAATAPQILATIAGFEISVLLYQAAKNDAAGRKACLSAIVRDIASSAERLVVERDESTLKFDRQVLFDATRRHGCTDSLTYELFAPHEDPLLWIPDAVAWAWVKGGEWKDAVTPYSTLIRV